MLKFATFQITSAVLAGPGMSRTASLQMQAHRAVFEYEPRPGFLYVRSRAISSRCNDNFDEFPAEEIEKAYRTFIGKPVFVNHHNENHRRARGVIIDAALHKDANADGSPDTWAEVLMEVDAVRFPLLAKAILAGEIDRTSMGTDVAYSICSACGNKASSPAEYCAHIPRMKGKRLFQVNASTGQKEGVLIREKCFGLKFFENSLLVEQPADPTAYFLGVDDRGLKMNASLEQPRQFIPPGAPTPAPGQPPVVVTFERDVVTAKKRSLPKHQKCNYCTAPAISRLLWAEGMAYIPHCAEHRDDAVAAAGGPNEVSGEQPTADAPSTTAALSFEAFVTQGERIEFSPEEQDFHRQMRDAGEMRAQMGDYERQRPVNLADPHDLKSHMIGAHGWTDDDFWRNSHDPDHPRMMEGSDDDRPLTHQEIRGAHDHEHEVEYPEDYPHTTLGDSHFHHAGWKASSALNAEAKGRKPVSQMSEEELADFRSRQEEGKAWNRKNPVRIKNVVDHWNQATDDEKANGMSWYEDAHHLSKHIANDTGTPMHTMAGLMTNYSPQTHWAQNIHTAARVARTKQPLGGKGEGVMATAKQKAAAGRMLDGEHYSDVFQGAPKVKAFGHLIEHGDGGADGHVVVDRHALSVAAGSRATDMAYEQSGLGGKRRYEEVANVYRKAAKVISKAEGKEVLPHHVQAATWLVRQRLNEAHDRELSKTAGSRPAANAKHAIREWNKYAAEHHPGAIGKEPGTGYSSQAPDDVKHAAQMHEEDQTMTKASAFVPTAEDLLDFVDHFDKVAYGETKAPADVDTLRDEECPVCGETDSYDGNACQVCGFDAPPPMFQDPNLEMAKSLDLRKDILNDAGTLPGAATDGMTPGEQDANAGLPGEVPGEGVPGSDQVGVPVDPSMVDADGNVTPTTDPAQVLQQQMDLLNSGQPITPDMIGPNGEVAVDPEAATGHFDQGGEPFTQGPNAPQQPGEPEGPVSPDDLDEEGAPEAADGQEEVPEQGEGDPGTPEDGVADLQCPACGFQADAEQPTSVDMDDQALPSGGAGTMAGDVCPNCGQAQLLSVGEMEQMAGAPARV